MSSRLTIFIFLFFALPGIVTGQESTTLKATVDKQQILLGEPFTLTVEASFAPGSTVSFINIDSILHFEWLDKPVTDTSNKNGRTIIRGSYQLTSFDSGHWVIPVFSLSGAVRSDTIGIDVVFSAFDPGQNYHDIKEIIDVRPAKEKQWWWYVAGGGLLLALLLFYFLRRKKPAPAARQEPRIDAYEEAIRQLEQLQRSKTDHKQYYTKLTEIFRLYVFRRKGVLSLQKTTDDLVVQLKDLGMQKGEFEKLAQSLRLGDLVKFAKYEPSDADDRAAYTEILQSINSIEKAEAHVSPGGRN